MAHSFCLPCVGRVCLLAIALIATRPSPATAQFSDELRDRTVAAGSSANFFFEWHGAASLSGVEVTIPAGWRLEGIDVVRNGFEPLAGRLDSDPSSSGSARFVLQADVRDRVMVLVRVQLPSSPEFEEIEVVPLTRFRAGSEPSVDTAYRAVRRVRVERAAPTNANRSLSLSGSVRESVLLRADRLPDLSTDNSFSVEFWLKTTVLDEVVLSTWDGEESHSYPLEIVVGRDGRLMSYRGRPGEHQAMTTNAAVADGSWHHVAVVHDSPAGWTRLYLDGAAQDSLYSPHAPLLPMPDVLAVGSRIAQIDASTAPGFAGEIDELRFWSMARSIEALRSTMRKSLESENDSNAFFSFETPFTPDVLARPTSARRERTDLSFAHPVQELRVSSRGEGITLTWQTSGNETAHFVIERSDDGVTFREAGRLDASEVVGEPEPGEPHRYEFSETPVREGVVYYRVRQILTDGSVRLTASVKIGLGRSSADDQAVLIGNYPNPFNEITTITYSLQKPMHVRLSVWDVAGQPVADLVSEVQDPGFYETGFEADELPSGTYFVRLQTPTNVAWRTITLAK